MTAPRLDDLVARARTVEVRPAVAAQAVAAVLARVPEARPWWRGWLAPAAVLAVGAVVAALVLRRAAPAAPAIVEIGGRVAIVVEPGSQFRVARTDDAGTEIEVARGAVTARLWPGATTHRLVLRGGGVEARATGTVYTLAVRDGAAEVDVHEGTVTVHRPEGDRAVVAGTAWSTRGDVTRPRTGVQAAARLASAPAPTPPPPPAIAVAVDAGPADAPAPAVDADPAVDASPAAAVAPSRGEPAVAAALPAGERYRRARLLRSQGDAAAARRDLERLIDDDDPTWAPIAAVEVARIDLDALRSPERAVTDADRFLARWPAHPLVAEVRALRCRALAQLGRGC